MSLNSPMYRKLKALAENDSFISCTLLSDAQRSERYDMDLALRFVTLRDIEPKDIGDVHDFLRDRMEVIALDKTFDFDAEVSLFEEVFAYLDRETGGDSFRPWNTKLKTFRGAFSLAAFEGIGLSVGRHWRRIKQAGNRFDMEGVIKEVWTTEAYKKSFSGLRARERMLRVKPVADRVIVAALEKAEKEKRAALKKAPTKKVAAKKVAKSKAVSSPKPGSRVKKAVAKKTGGRAIAKK